MKSSGNTSRKREQIAGIQALVADKEPGTAKALQPESASGSVVPAEKESPVDLPPGVDVAQEAGTQFQIQAHLGFWMSERFVMVSSVSDEASEQLQDVLARNIFSALGETVEGESRHIRWPIFGNPRVPCNAEEDFSYLLRSFSREFGSRKQLLLGVLPTDLLPDRSRWLADTLGTPQLDFPRSLAELAAVPAYKRELWHQLKAVVGD